MPATSLRHFAKLGHHIVAQIVKTKFVVGAVGDIGRVGLAPLHFFQIFHFYRDLIFIYFMRLIQMRFVVLYASHAQTQQLIDRPHPVGVALGQIIVNRDHVHTLTRQGVQINC